MSRDYYENDSAILEEIARQLTRIADALEEETTYSPPPVIGSPPDQYAITINNPPTSASSIQVMKDPYGKDFK